MEFLCCIRIYVKHRKILVEKVAEYNDLIARYKKPFATDFTIFTFIHSQVNIQVIIWNKRSPF